MAGYEDYLKNLLGPLGIYDLRSGTASESELFAAAAELDGTAVEVLATRQESMADSVGRLDEKLDALERRPAKRWESLTDKLLLALAGAFVSFLLTRGGGL